MLEEAILSVMTSSLEIGAGLVLLYFLYTVWRDARNAFLG